MPSTVTNSGALTLADYAKRSDNLIEQKLIDNIYRTSNILKDLRMKDTGVQLRTVVERLTNSGLGSVSWASLGEKGDVYSADTELHGEAAFLIRNRIEVDKLLLNAKPKPINDPVDIRMKAWVESLAFELNDTFFNNTPSANSKAWIGLNHRVKNYAQYNVHSSCNIDAGGVDLTRSAASASTALLFFEWVDEALAKLGNPDGKNCVLYMDGTPLRTLRRVVRSGSNLLRMTTDNFDTSIEMYKNMKLVDTGFKQDRTTRVLPITDTSAGVAGSSTYTSAFIVDYSDGKFGSWKFGGFAPVASGIDPSNDVLWRASFEFGVGLAPATDNCFARIYDIKAG